MYVTYLESTLSGMTSSPILCLSLCFFLCFLLDLERDVSFLSLSSSAETSTLNSPNENMFNSGVDRYYFNKVTVTFNIYRFLALTTSSPLHQLPKFTLLVPLNLISMQLISSHGTNWIISFFPFCILIYLSRFLGCLHLPRLSV